MKTDAGRVENEEIDDETDDEIDEAGDGAHADTIVMTEMPLTDGGADTAEIQVDKLIAQVESQSEKDILRKKKVRQRLEEWSEEMSHEDTFAYDGEDGEDGD
jgi:hypothetical protein